MLHHLLYLPFLIFHLIVGVLLVLVALVVLRPLALIARCGCASRANGAPQPRASDNAAFEDYRQATLKRLEQEAEEFRSYLARLRRAADAAAFEAFLKARKAGESPAS